MDYLSYATDVSMSFGNPQEDLAKTDYDDYDMVEEIPRYNDPTTQQNVTFGFDFSLACTSTGPGSIWLADFPNIATGYGAPSRFATIDGGESPNFLPVLAPVPPTQPVAPECMALSTQTAVKPQLHPCRHCNRTYGEAKSLYRHVRSFHQGFTFPCRSCGKRFKRRDIRTRHIEEQHAENGEKACENCGKPVARRLASRSNRCQTCVLGRGPDHVRVGSARRHESSAAKEYAGLDTRVPSVLLTMDSLLLATKLITRVCLINNHWSLLRREIYELSALIYSTLCAIDLLNIATQTSFLSIYLTTSWLAKAEKYVNGAGYARIHAAAAIALQRRYDRWMTYEVLCSAVTDATHQTGKEHNLLVRTLRICRARDEDFWDRALRVWNSDCTCNRHGGNRS